MIELILAIVVVVVIAAVLIINAVRKERSLERFKKEYDKKVGSGMQGAAANHPSSTTQGGSDYGQGSSQLDSKSYEQGAAKNNGSNYSNEKWPSSEANEN